MTGGALEAAGQGLLGHRRVCVGVGGVGWEWEEGLQTDEMRCLDPSRSHLGQGSRFSESETPGKSPGDW